MTMELQEVIAALELRLLSGGIVPSMSTSTSDGEDSKAALGRCGKRPCSSRRVSDKTNCPTQI
jgi:hypothetical protein